MSTYSRLAPQPWQQDKTPSSIEALMRLYNPPEHEIISRTLNMKPRQLTRMFHYEEQYALQVLKTRKFGHSWLKPIGVAKTMGQIEDEARETQDSFEEYEDEDNLFNQNNPDILGGIDGQDIMSEEGPEREEPEAQDLDDEIEEGASFDVDVDETSYISSTSPALRHDPGQLGSTSTPVRASATGQADDQLQDLDEGMASAEEGSIGGYSTEEESDHTAD